MKGPTALVVVGLGLGAAGLVAAHGCAGESDAAPVGPGKQPVAKPEAPPTTATDDKTFAVQRLLLGDLDRAGVANKDAWQAYAFNVDGLTTTRESKNVCARQAGASIANQEDGTDGVDNALGKTVVPLLHSLMTTSPSKTVNDAIAKGEFTMMLKIRGLTDDPAQTNTGLSGTLLLGAVFDPVHNTTPTFTAADDWPHRKEPQVTLGDAYVSNGTFVNGSARGLVRISLYFHGAALDLTVHKAAITFDHASPNEASNGTIAGVVATEELVGGVEKIAGSIAPQLCNRATLDSLKIAIRQASDILRDGTNRAGVPCDGISVGMGFSAKKVANPTKLASEDAPPPDPCAAHDAGHDG